jgi:hypothetical protein
MLFLSVDLVRQNQALKHYVHIFYPNVGTVPKNACNNSNPLSQRFRSTHINSVDSLFIFVIKILSFFFFQPKLQFRL